MRRGKVRLLLCGLISAALLNQAVAWATAQRPVQTLVRVAQVQEVTPDQVIEMMQAGRLTEAEQAARQAAKAHPESARSRLLIARILARQGRLDEARASLEEAQALPQWEEQELGVPYQSPRKIERVMQRDPDSARGLIADVLLAQGDDPKAYYLLALTEAVAHHWQDSQRALSTAEFLEPGLPFAHPDTLASLKQALSQQSGSFSPPQQLFSPEPRPWWQWAAGVGVFALGLGLNLAWRGLERWNKEEAQKRAEGLEMLTRLQRELDHEIAEAKRQHEAKPSGEGLRRLQRLQKLRSRFPEWRRDIENDPAYSEMVSTQYATEFAAAQSDQAYHAYEVEKARFAREMEKQERRERKVRENRDREEKTSFRSREDSASWSSGDSSSSRDNSGGSKW